MENLFNDSQIEKLTRLCASSERIVVTSHANPDGDAIGSGVALLHTLRQVYPNKTIRFFVPNHFPEFLSWIDPEKKDIEIYIEKCNETSAFIAAADLIFIVDFNRTARLERMQNPLEANIHAPRVLIDHHLDPAEHDLMFHSTLSSSSAFLVYNLISHWVGTDKITKHVAEALYMGIMTDTGSFAFSNLTPELFRAVAILLERGLNIPKVYQAIYNVQSEDRIRLSGYLLGSKMVINREKSATYITLTKEEKDRYNYQIGDTEGIVNIPLSIAGINFAAMLIETKDCIKISLRSVGKLDVNKLANKYFNGGGHANAAGGKFFGTMEDAIVALQKMIANEL